MTSFKTPGELSGRWFEAMATLREVALMPRDLAPVIPDVRAGDDVVVMVHGLCASAGVFRPMAKRIAADTGAKIATFSHLPGVGVRRIALSLTKLIDRLPSGAKIHLIGHSLGGLVARWYVEELGGHMRVAQTIALASPFGGAPVAELFPWLVGADLRRASELLENMRAGERAKVPHTSIVGTADLIVHHTSGAFAHGEHIVLPHRGHNSLLYDEEVMKLIVARIRRHQMAAAPRADVRDLENQATEAA
jgi:triacylglycerol lipase